jgi:hypothetical protein
MPARKDMIVLALLSLLPIVVGLALASPGWAAVVLILLLTVLFLGRRKPSQGRAVSHGQGVAAGPPGREAL